VIRRALLLLVALSAGACDRGKPAAPPPSADAPSQDAAPQAGQARRAIQVHDAPRSGSGLACWNCHLDAAAELRKIAGVSDVQLYPDAGIVIVVHTGALKDPNVLLAAVKRAIPESTPEAIDEPDSIPQRLRMTRETPEAVTDAIAKADETSPIAIVKFTAGACARCLHPEPVWGSVVVRTDIDVEKTPGVKPWIALQAVPEWVAFDRKGRQLRRWTGRVDPKEYKRELGALLDKAD
jgi:hypothetical protein